MGAQESCRFGLYGRNQTTPAFRFHARHIPTQVLSNVKILLTKFNEVKLVRHPSAALRGVRKSYWSRACCQTAQQYAHTGLAHTSKTAGMNVSRLSISNLLCIHFLGFNYVSGTDMFCTSASNLKRPDVCHTLQRGTRHQSPPCVLARIN